MKIDAHQHFWNYDPVRHSWMSEEMEVLKTNLLPPDLLPHLQKKSFEGCVAVQADQSEEENTFLLQLGEQYDFIKGIVGWVDLRAANIEERLAYYQQFPKIKGFRHILQSETARDLMLHSAFKNGISYLKKYNYNYDILIFTDQLPYTVDFVKAFPEQLFVIDHIAKPQIKEQKVGDWETYMKKIASFENVYCKISGMVTEADWGKWERENFKKYLDVAVEAFGTDRLMYGSDWPVCHLAATYEEQFGIVEAYFSQFTETEQDKFFGKNACQFYRI